MNRHFLEFWGKALLQAAQSQKQWEDLARWVQGGFAGFPQFTRLFKTAYGLEEAPEDSPDFFALWKKAEQDFRRSFEDYLSLLGMVPREEYDSLKRQCADLQEKVEEQEELIQGLKALAEDKGMGLEAATLELQKLVQKQGDQFQEFIQGLGASLKPDQPQD
jgi:BMFP domain-containing protein YqiC